MFEPSFETSISPCTVGPSTFENEYWKREYSRRKYYRSSMPFDAIAPAYRYGWEACWEARFSTWEAAEIEARSRWYTEDNIDEAWESVRPAFRDGWNGAAESKQEILEKEAMDQTLVDQKR